MQLPAKFQSIWTGTTPGTEYPELKEELETDVVIIGGGIAGLNAAYFLKRSGQKVVVIEANKIVTGTSGNTTAKVTSLHELRYAYLAKKFGQGSARIYADSNQWAIKELENIIKAEDIDCDFYQASAFTYTRTKEALNRIKQEAEIASQLGIPAFFVKALPADPFKIQGAVKFDNQAYFHPRKYLLKIAEKVSGEGSFIFESTRALDIKEDNELCKVKTNQTNLRAKFVIIATNFPFYDPNGVFSKVSRTGSYALAVKAAKIPEGMFLGTRGEDLSFRPQKEKKNEWLIIGGKHRGIDEIGNINKRLDGLAKMASENFQISSIEYKWGAQDTMSLDLVPYIGRMPAFKRIFVATGFSTWGMSTSFVSAKLLTDLILEKSNPWEYLYDPARLVRR